MVDIVTGFLGIMFIIVLIMSRLSMILFNIIIKSIPILIVLLIWDITREKSEMKWEHQEQA